MFPEVWRYNGSRNDVKECPHINYHDINSDCTAKNAPLRMPAKAYTSCQCYKRCEGYEFTVVGYDKIHHRTGKLVTKMISYR